MIIPPNGFIEAEETISGGFVNGIPQPASTGWGSPIPCHILKNTEDNKGNYKDGKFTRYAFTVWFDMQDFSAKRVRLTDNRGNVKGEFEVQGNPEFCDSTNRVKIML